MPSAPIAKRLFNALLRQSRALHSRMLDGHLHGVEQHEETLTESLLLELSRAMPSVTVRTYTRAEESRETGADWAWWWEGDRRWFGALVQAKRLDPTTQSYDFGYMPRPSRRQADPQRQIDLLMEAARDLDLPPLYVLYNGPGFRLDPGRWACDEIAFDESAMGAAILPAAVAAWLLALSATDQDSVAGFSRPLPCHVCPQRCSNFAALSWYLRAPVPLAKSLLGFPDDVADSDLALRAASSYLAGLANARIRQFRAQPTSPELAVVRQGVRTTPPDYVLAALTGDVDDVADPIDGAPARVVIMRRPDQ